MLWGRDGRGQLVGLVLSFHHLALGVVRPSGKCLYLLRHPMSYKFSSWEQNPESQG